MKNKIGDRLGQQRTYKISRLRGAGALIFGFGAEYFITDYDRATVQEFQGLLGVKNTPKGKHYPMLPPILYPEGSGMDPKQLFLNPALVKVSVWTGIELSYE